MKLEDEVKNQVSLAKTTLIILFQMISGEGPILIAKASEFLIEELTLRAWLHAENHRRKTLQKIDIANATLQNDMFDFLVDIVPRKGSQPEGPVPIVSSHPVYNPIIFSVPDLQPVLQPPVIPLEHISKSSLLHQHSQSNRTGNQSSITFNRYILPLNKE